MIYSSKKIHLKNRIIGLCILVMLAMFLVNVEATFAATSGTCGTEASWELQNGILTVSGSGFMNNFTESDMAPWYENRNEITSVVIEEGIVNVSSLAFYGCENLQKVQLSDSVRSIDELAFAGCESLKMIFPGTQLKTIEAQAFEGCTSLQSITLPNGLWSIGDQAFYRCESLVSIRIPETVYSIGSEAFAYCSSLQQVSIDAYLKQLPEWVFYGCESLVNVSLQSTYESIGIYSFKGCTSLETVYHAGNDTQKTQILQQIQQQLPNFSQVISAPATDVLESERTENNTNDDGSVTETKKDVIDSANSTIQTTIQSNPPSAENGNQEEIDISVDATIDNEEGWQEVVDRITEVVKYPELLESDDTFVDVIQVEVLVRDNLTVEAEVFSQLVGKPVQLNINTAQGTSWSIRGEDLSQDALSRKYNLSFTVKKNEEPTKAQKELLQDAVSYLLEFEDEIPFPLTVRVQLPIEHARQYATLFQKAIFKKWEQVQTVLIDDEGYASFNLDGIDKNTKYMIGIDVPGADVENVVIPESMYEEYGGLTDANGVHYEITGTKSAIGISFTQVTLILIGILVVSILVVGIIVRMSSKASYAKQELEEVPKKQKKVKKPKDKKEKNKK